MIGYAVTGSFCTHSQALVTLESLISLGYDVLPIVSETVFSTDTRFGRAEQFVSRMETLCAKRVLHSIVGTEPLGPKTPLDLLIIAPCTGNTLAKMANGITDTSVTMAAKAQLRGDRPLLVGLCSNDALSANMANLACMRQKKHVSFVPLKMDDPEGKPYSLVCDFSAIPDMVRKILTKGT